MSKNTPIKNFETNLKELEELVEALESGDLSLEASLAYFEKGVTKTQACQKALADAEQRVNVLIEQNGELVLEPVNGDEAN